MKRVAIVLSSVRPESAGDAILTEVQKEIRDRPHIKAEVVDFRQMPLPLFDNDMPPGVAEYAPSNDNVKSWIKKVDQADTVLIISAEYNYSYTGALKNAIDLIPPSILENKSFSFIGYGWGGGAKGIAKTRTLLTEFLKANPSEHEANLKFTKDINTDGSAIDANAVSASIAAVLDEIENR